MNGNIFLIGFMGCGKSSIAKELSRELGFPVLEMDEKLVEQEGKSISKIFEENGEAYFRQIETELLQKVSGEQVIVSCGGGTPLREENVKLMKVSGKVIWLTAKPETILERVKNDTKRPLLQGKKTVEGIQSLLEGRLEKYERAADFCVATDQKSLDEICKEIQKNTSRHG